MCNTSEIFLKKQLFLSKYNPTRNVEEALSKSFDAALQHNKLYNFDTSVGRRKEIRAFWGCEILRLSQRYVDAVSVEDFEQDILELRSSMNDIYQNYFGVEGFKISHSQKSLSVFLKIQWANRKLKIPPLCPVDRTILKIAGERDPDAWTHINTMPEYRRFIRILKQATHNHTCKSLACWELCNFG